MRRGWWTAGLIVLGGLSAGAGGQEVPPPKDKEIIVEGRREPPLLDGGEWTVTLSRPYGDPRTETGEMRADAPPEKTWRFCLRQIAVESLIRVLIGQGRTDTTSSPAYCKPVRVSLGKGRVRASQRCQGGRMLTGRAAGNISEQTPMSATINTSGRYTPTSLKLDFTSDRESNEIEPGQSAFRAMTRWSVEGKRLAACQAPALPKDASRPEGVIRP